MAFFVYIVYVPLFAFPGLTLSGYYPSPKVLKISIVFSVYIVYKLLLLSLAESAEDVHGFLRLHRLCTPVYFSRSDTQWLLSLAESARDFHGFLYLHRLRAPVCVSMYDIMAV